jgi:chaperonin GroEL (HSP60 family)
VERISKRHIDAVQQITGAKLLRSVLSPISAQDCGQLQELKMVAVDEHKYIAMVPAPPLPTPSTLLVYCPDTFAQDELRPELKAAVQVMTSLLYEPELCAGAGCSEIFLAAYLRKKASSLSIERVRQLDRMFVQKPSQLVSKIKQCIEIYAECLEAQATQLEPDDPKEQVLDILISANRLNLKQPQSVLYGWDPIEKRQQRVLDLVQKQAVVVESLALKKQILQGSAELCAILAKLGATVKI